MKKFSTAVRKILSGFMVVALAASIAGTKPACRNRGKDPVKGKDIIGFSIAIKNPPVKSNNP